jgi:serine/threonine-protein kinase
VKGRTLAELLAEGKRWGAREAAALGAEICGAVAAVHAAGLVHRDIKAANVMLQDDGRVVLMDFGTGTGVADPTAPLAGTPLYLAPELFAGGAPSIASDIYSLGVLLYHLLTRSYPVRAQDESGLRLAHQRGERRPIADARPDLPRRLARAIDRAIDADPAQRHRDAATFARELSEIARLRLTKGVRAVAVAAG